MASIFEATVDKLISTTGGTVTGHNRRTEVTLNTDSGQITEWRGSGGNGRSFIHCEQ